ncbi:uncharacterized protein J3R85_020777 [Psidium guajava]|nr:uncharacterized protein J3R85_020777 [Psidium guajava]
MRADRPDIKLGYIFARASSGSHTWCASLGAKHDGQQSASTNGTPVKETPRRISTHQSLKSEKSHQKKILLPRPLPHESSSSQKWGFLSMEQIRDAWLAGSDSLERSRETHQMVVARPFSPHLNQEFFPLAK